MAVVSRDRNTQADAYSHDPGPDADPLWAEGFCLTWYDPHTRAGGFHHLTRRPQRDLADLWNFVVLEGQVIGKEHKVTLPLPGGDFDDFTLNSLRIRTLEPTVGLRVSSDFGATRTDVEYSSFRPATYYSMNKAESTIGADHYESLGRVIGTVEHAGRTSEVNGFAFNDHSWGRRDLSHLLSHRWVLANFGPDLCVCVWTFVAPNGMKVVHGYVWDDGEFVPIQRAAIHVAMSDDGHTPIGGDIRLWAVDGRGWHLTGQCDVGSLYYSEHFMVTPAFATFECGGRLGSGLLEVNELKRPAPWHWAELGLDAAGWPRTRSTDR